MAGLRSATMISMASRKARALPDRSRSHWMRRSNRSRSTVSSNVLDVTSAGATRLSGLIHNWLVGSGRCGMRSEEHTSELQSLMRISYAVFCLKKKNQKDEKYHI